MRRRLRVLRVGAGGFLLWGCSDAVAPVQTHNLDITVPSLERAPAASWESDDIVPPPPIPEGEIPPEFRAPPEVVDYSLDAGFVPGEAYGIAHMTAIAALLEQTLTLTVRTSDQQMVRTETAAERKKLSLPWRQELTTSLVLPVATDCGLNLYAVAIHLAAQESFIGPNPVRFTEIKEESRKSASQSECAPPPRTGGGGGGGSTVQICQWIEWTDEATGEYQGTEFLGCYTIPVDNA